MSGFESTNGSKHRDVCCPIKLYELLKKQAIISFVKRRTSNFKCFCRKKKYDIYYPGIVKAYMTLEQVEWVIEISFKRNSFSELTKPHQYY
jgi:hypothetical protein